MTFVRSAALTHPGRKRPNNEDFVTYFEPNDKDELSNSGSIYILADGVGGASLGEHASQYAAQKVLYEYYQYPQIPPANRLKTIIKNTGNEIFDFAEQQEHFMRMGTTIVVAVIRNGMLQVAHVGDSRAYLIQNDKVIQLTRDHSTVGEMTRDGILTEEEAMHFQGRNLLSRSLGGHQDVIVDVTEEIAFTPGSKLLLVSDGFSRYATREQIRTLLADGHPNLVAQQMIEFANQHGGADNISIILVESLQEQDQTRTIPMGQQPIPVDWDSIPTDHSIFDSRKRKRDRRKKIVLYIGIAAGIAIILLCLSFAKNMINHFFPTEIPPSPIIDPEVLNSSTPVVTSTFPVILTRTLGVTPTETPTTKSTEEVTHSPTPSPTGTGPQTLEPIGDCIYKVLQEDMIEGQENGDLFELLRDKFGYLEGHPAGYEDFIDYASNITSEEYNSEEAYYILADWTLVLPDIPNTLCEEKGGRLPDE